MKPGSGTYIWDFAEFDGDNVKVGKSGIQTYEYNGLSINIGNTNDRINTTGDAGTTYYIINKSRSVNIYSIKFIPE